MDYERIYQAFIEDRRLLEPTLTSYFEKHHIAPRSLGGGNERANIIKLTAEDHFFAHLLLAKIHGGGMWTAVRRMRWGRVGGERPWVAGRYMYALARQKHAEVVSETQKGRPGKRGAHNGMHDAKPILWTSLDTGETLLLTKAAMWSRFGGCRAHWTSAANGSRRSHFGWTAKPSSARIRSHKGQLLRFENANGGAFVGTQKDFCQMSGLSIAVASRIARHGAVSKSGWRRNLTCRQPHEASG